MSRAEHLQREYLANLQAAAPVKKQPDREYGSAVFWIYIRKNIFHKIPEALRLEMEQINQVKFGQNTYYHGK